MDYMTWRFYKIKQMYDDIRDIRAMMLFDVYVVIIIQCLLNMTWRACGNRGCNMRCAHYMVLLYTIILNNKLIHAQTMHTYWRCVLPNTCNGFFYLPWFCCRYNWFSIQTCVFGRICYIIKGCGFLFHLGCVHNHGSYFSKDYKYLT